MSALDGARWRRGAALVVMVASLAPSSCRKPAATSNPQPVPNAERAFADLRAQVDCGPRVVNRPGVECCRGYIVRTLTPLAERVAAQRFSLPDPYGGDSLRFVNLQANFHTRRPARVLLAAHYDTRPRADQDSGAARELPIPGANDGASGVAVLLEVARALATWDPGIGVDLVFLDGEDYGREGEVDYYCLGAKAFVRAAGAYRPRAVILVDMVGDRDLHIPMEANSRQMAPALTRLVFAVAESLGVSQFSSTAGPALYDDHIPFLQAGIPALDLIDFEYPAWHTSRDTPEQCAPASLAAVVRVLLGSLSRLAATTR